MAATANITVSGNFSSLATGSRTVGPNTVTSTNANGQVQQIVLQSGANTVTVPSTPATTGCVIVLPSTNTALTTLKGVTGDTGVPIGKVGTIMLSWDSGNAPSSFCLTSASTQTGLVTEISFF